MRDNKIRVPVDDKVSEAANRKAAAERHLTPANSYNDLNLVKIASDWKRRNQEVPKWWRDHLLGMFR